MCIFRRVLAPGPMSCLASTLKFCITLILFKFAGKHKKEHHTNAHWCYSLQLLFFSNRPETHWSMVGNSGIYVNTNPSKREFVTERFDKMGCNALRCKNKEHLAMFLMLENFILNRPETHWSMVGNSGVYVRTILHSRRLDETPRVSTFLSCQRA